MEVPKFQAKIRISMVLREVFEPFAVVDLNSCPISLIDGFLGDVRQILWFYEGLLEFFILAVDLIDQINRTILADRFHFSHYLD
jgi:hypothetical protein